MFKRIGIKRHLPPQIIEVNPLTFDSPLSNLLWKNKIMT